MEIRVTDRIAGEIIEGNEINVLREAVERVHDYKATHPNVVLSAGENTDELEIKES